jgi:RNA polymerase sigma-70 factor (ECF subfamily)
MLPEKSVSFRDEVTELFHGHFQRIQRYLMRLSGDPELAADLTQEAFIRLHRRGSLPDAPAAWLISVAMNLLRNEAATRGRRRRLLTVSRSEEILSSPPASPERVVASDEVRRKVRSALELLPKRERHLLLLQAEGYSYRDMALALRLNEASVGVLLARARQAFRGAYGDATDAS